MGDGPMKKMAANKGFQATAHKLSHGTGLRSLHSLFLQPVGRRLNPDVGHVYMRAIIISIGVLTASVLSAAETDLSGTWISGGGYTVYTLDLVQTGNALTGNGQMSTCITQGVPFVITGTIAETNVTLGLTFTHEEWSQTNTYTISHTARGNYLFLDGQTFSNGESCRRLFKKEMYDNINAQQVVPGYRRQGAPQPEP